LQLRTKLSEGNGAVIVETAITIQPYWTVFSSN